MEAALRRWRGGRDKKPVSQVRGFPRGYPGRNGAPILIPRHHDLMVLSHAPIKPVVRASASSHLDERPSSQGVLLAPGYLLGLRGSGAPRGRKSPLDLRRRRFDSVGRAPPMLGLEGAGGGDRLRQPVLGAPPAPSRRERGGRRARSPRVGGVPEEVGGRREGHGEVPSPNRVLRGGLFRHVAVSRRGRAALLALCQWGVPFRCQVLLRKRRHSYVALTHTKKGFIIIVHLLYFVGQL